MTLTIFSSQRTRAVLAGMSPRERDTMRALRSGAQIEDRGALPLLERRQLVRLVETTDGEVWAFTRLGGDVADWLINGPAEHGATA